MARLVAEIINRYQHRSFVNRMRMEVRASVDSARELEEEIEGRLAEIVSSIGEKSSVPKVSYTPAMCLYPYLF
jgi:F0F1-type ATP synthase delta subunit